MNNMAMIVRPLISIGFNVLDISSDVVILFFFQQFINPPDRADQYQETLYHPYGYGAPYEYPPFAFYNTALFLICGALSQLIYLLVLLAR